jgi:predicted 3-demethylubiquinone-9 3-methyltransferase (glyoxalase superfamily)
MQKIIPHLWFDKKAREAADGAGVTAGNRQNKLMS